MKMFHHRENEGEKNWGLERYKLFAKIQSDVIYNHNIYYNFAFVANSLFFIVLETKKTSKIQRLSDILTTFIHHNIFYNVAFGRVYFT